MGEGVTELAGFVNRTGGLRRGVARDAPRKTELPKQAAHAFVVLRDVRVNFAIGAFEPGIRNHSRTTVTGTANVDHVQVTCLDDTIEMRVNKIQAWRRAPVAEKPRLYV